jgi:hypothetical protein
MAAGSPAFCPSFAPPRRLPHAKAFPPIGFRSVGLGALRVHAEGVCPLGFRHPITTTSLRGTKQSRTCRVIINASLLLAAGAKSLCLRHKVTKSQVKKMLPSALPVQLLAGGGCPGHSRQRWPAFLTGLRTLNLRLIQVSSIMA